MTAYKQLESSIHPITNEPHDFNPLLKYIDDEISLVLLGEATHGTLEFYETRAKLTQELIEKKGFNTILIEGDWPNTHQLDLYIKEKNTPTPKMLFQFLKNFLHGCGRMNLLLTCLNG